MFDPDNFYEILKCEYAWPKTHNVFMIFSSHGSKDFDGLAPVPSEETKFIWYHDTNKGDKSAFGRIILHDQEPFSIDNAVFTYKRLLQKQKYYPNKESLDLLPINDLINTFFKSGLSPILCHSEINSADVDYAVSNCLMIGCYYWYHAMISRDWYRHWQYHPKLIPADRSRAPYRFMMYARGLDGSRMYRKKFIENMSRHKEKIFYDWDQKSSISSDYSAKIDVNDANVGSIHIVLETLFDTSKIHLTEKIFKPMVMSQPFFLLAGPGSLKYLHNYGFRTFGDFWDEAYDQINDHQERMHRIQKEILNLICMPQEKFDILYKNILPIVEHNRRHFFSQEFQEFCVNEMKTNFRLALEKQQQNQEIYPGGPWAKLVSDTLNRGLPVPDAWGDIMRDFLKSRYLSVPKQQIVQTYPILEQFLN